MGWEDDDDDTGEGVNVDGHKSSGTSMLSATPSMCAGFKRSMDTVSSLSFNFSLKYLASLDKTLDGPS